MRIVDVRELSVPISRYADPAVPSCGLTTSVVAVIRRYVEVNPLCFQPFGRYGDDTIISEGIVIHPESPGIGFESRKGLRDFFATLPDV